MRHEIDTDKSGVQLSDETNLRALDAVVTRRATEKASWPDFVMLDDGTHIWVAILALRALGRPDDRDWLEDFDRMVANAGSNG